jgi:hypothetical protein
MKHVHLLIVNIHPNQVFLSKKKIKEKNQEHMLRATKALFAVVVATTLLLVLTTLLHNNKINALPQGFMTFFDAQSCPSGWSEYSASQGRLIVSVDNSNNAGITVGVPLGDREDRTHSHRTSLTGDLHHQDIAGAGGSNQQGADHGSVSTKFISDESSSGLPFTQVILCRINSENADASETAIGTIAFFDPSVDGCPNINATKSSKNNKNNVKSTGTQWNTITALNGRIAVGGYYESGGLPNAEPSFFSGEDRKHNHTSNSVQVQESQVSYEGLDSCCNTGPAQFKNDLTLSGDSDSSSSNLPYLQLLTCASSDYSFNISLPDGALIFNQEKCPPGWELALEVAGRLLVSLPSGGQAGAYFGGNSFSPNAAVDPLHSHGLNATISFPSVGIELVSGCCGGPYAAAGSFPFAGTSTQNDVAVPYTYYPLCRQISDRKRSGKSVLAKEYAKYKKQKMLEGLKKH